MFTTKNYLTFEQLLASYYMALLFLCLFADEVAMTDFLASLLHNTGDTVAARCHFKPFVPNALFFYPLKTSENRKVF